MRREKYVKYIIKGSPGELGPKIAERIAAAGPRGNIRTYTIDPPELPSDDEWYVGRKINILASLDPVGDLEFQFDEAGNETKLIGFCKQALRDDQVTGHDLRCTNFFPYLTGILDLLNLSYEARAL